MGKHLDRLVHLAIRIDRKLQVASLSKFHADSLRKPLTDALHALDIDFVLQLKKYMQIHRKRFDSAISSVMINKAENPCL